MLGQQHPRRIWLQGLREQIVARLSEAFAREELGLDEFEQRVSAAYQLESPARLSALVGDLPGPDAAEAGPAPALRQRVSQRRPIRAVEVGMFLFYAMIAFGVFSLADCAVYVWRH